MSPGPHPMLHDPHAAHAPRHAPGARPRRGAALVTLTVGLASLLWLALRAGRKPARLAYPCQQAALSAASLAWLVALSPAALGAARWAARRRSRVAATLGLAVALALGGLSDAAVGPGRAMRVDAVPADYDADLYVVEHAGGPAGDRHPGLDRLVTDMGSLSMKLYRSATVSATSGPDGVVRADDVVLIKVNAQWPERGGTNTDVLRGLITLVLEHPDGFRGEVVVVDNGQGGGSFDWPGSNAEDHAQSAGSVVRDFAGRGLPVSSYLWDGIRATQVGEYSEGDARDGYVVGAWDDDAQIRVSYPKFRTAGGRLVSLKYGLWDSVASAYDDTRLRFLNVPVLKCHGIYGVTGALKHHVGTMTTSLGTNTHLAVLSGGLGAFLAQVRMPDLNLLDAIYVIANPDKGPAGLYGDATRTDVLMASRDPVALDLWAVANVLVPTMVANGFAEHVDQDPFDTTSVFRRYLDRTTVRLRAAGIPVTNDLGHVVAHRFDAAAVESAAPARGRAAFPNPFVTSTRIALVPARTGAARLEVRDVAGRLVRAIAMRVERGAACSIEWDGRDGTGRRAAPGTYAWRVTGAGAPVAGRVTLLR